MRYYPPTNGRTRTAERPGGAAWAMERGSCFLYWLLAMDVWAAGPALGITEAAVCIGVGRTV